jgi:heterodisulfide reductase subunit C
MWVCASCETCTTRCPNGIDVAHVMDTLRKMSVKAKKVNQPQVPLFHNTFLGSIKRHGKIHEFEMITLYTLKNQGLGGLISQAKGLGLKMLRRGKLKILPYSLTGNSEVKQLFKQEQKQR